VTSAAPPKEDGSEMPTPANPQWAPGSGTGYRRYFRYGNASEVRASDAERTEVAERLSKHYSDGRLDQAEFNERLDRAMNAKTRADFSGLFYDLPDLPDESAKANKNGQQRFDPMKAQQRQDSRTRQRSTFSHLLFLAVIAIAAIVVAHVVLHSVFLWVMIAVVAFFWLRNEQGRRR
jgi:Domain of unknown function (DUF1707)